MRDKSTVEKALMKATTREEVKQILSEAGYEISDTEADQILGKTKLDPDELEALNGGAEENPARYKCIRMGYRSKSVYGCAATVEDGSDCWGTDGGCVTFNICYVA